jgi:rhamnogalacturonyl hydrolase YesR
MFISMTSLALRLSMLVIVASATMLNSPAQTQQRSWAEKFANTIIQTYPDSIVVRKYTTHGPSEEAIVPPPNHPMNWNYELGVLFTGFERLGQVKQDATYHDYTKKIMDKLIQPDGSIRTYEAVEFNIDHITPGVIALALYQRTKEEKYKKAIDQLRYQIDWQPRTKEGGFWHKHRYPYQMWLDGLYMAEPFYAQYATVFNRSKDYDDIVNQFVWMEKHARDERTGLLYHGWDESKLQRWANPQTGCSPEFWSRGMGWFAMAIVDVLDYLPASHKGRPQLIAMLQRLAVAIKKYQHPENGLWYQVTDKAHMAGNYPEASGSAMFVYALAKGVRLGYLDKSYGQVTQRGFQAIVNNFIQTDGDGKVHYLKTCSGAGLGGNPVRDGSYEYYIKEPLRTDDLKGIGPFIQASIEMEILKNSKP